MNLLTVLALLGAILVVPPPLSPSVATPSSSAQDRRADESLDLVIDRAALAATAFERRFASVVAEEHLEQRTSAGGQRVLRSDLLLVRIPGRDSWLPFRDVFEVNGRPVRDRSDRLQRMFAEGTDTALADARRISDEMWVVVTYAPSDALGIWVPTTMREWARDARLATVTGDARYSNFRRFEVTTLETFTPSQQR